MHRRIWLLVAAFVALSLALGTGGFSAASMDRGVALSVADHEHAFVSLVDPGAEGDRTPGWVDDPSVMQADPVTVQNAHVRLFVVHNRFAETTLRVDAADRGTGAPHVSNVETVRLVPNETAVVYGTVDCVERPGRSLQRLDLTVQVDGVGGQFSGTIDYPVTVVCARQGEGNESGAKGEGPDTSDRNAGGGGTTPSTETPPPERTETPETAT